MLFAKSNPTKVLESFFRFLEPQLWTSPHINILWNINLNMQKTKKKTFNLQEHKQKQNLKTFENKNKTFSFQKEKWEPSTSKNNNKNFQPLRTRIKTFCNLSKQKQELSTSHNKNKNFEPSRTKTRTFNFQVLNKQMNL